eukprot:364100-Chlamydomonas_euryale.AAC.77
MATLQAAINMKPGAVSGSAGGATLLRDDDSLLRQMFFGILSNPRADALDASVALHVGERLQHPTATSPTAAPRASAYPPTHAPAHSHEEPPIRLLPLATRGAIAPVLSAPILLRFRPRPSMVLASAEVCRRSAGYAPTAGPFGGGPTTNAATAPTHAGPKRPPLPWAQAPPPQPGAQGGRHLRARPGVEQFQRGRRL